MTRTLIITALFVLAGCVNDSPLYNTGFFSLPQESCTEFKFAEVQQFGGSLNLATVGAYQIGLKMQSEMDPDLDTTADDVTLVRAVQRNQINIDQINLTYTTVPSSIALEAESEALWFTVGPQAEAQVRLGSLVGEKAIEKLNTALPNPGDRADVRVKMTFSGNLNSGGRVVSAPAVFPITVFRGGGLPTCPMGQIIARNGPCGAVGGQDGYPVCCADPMSPTECAP